MEVCTVYVGCGLTQASEDFREFVAEFKQRLAQEPGIQVLEFVGLEAGTPADVYEHDLGNVARCDAMIVIADEPAIGLGMEIQHAISFGKPILVLRRPDTRISRMILGAGELGHLTVATYQELGDAVHIATAFIQPITSPRS